MLRFFTTLTCCTLAGASSAASISTLDVVLRLDSIGFTDVSTYNADFDLQAEGEFLNVEDDTWGITKPDERFTVGDEVSVTAEFDGSSGPLNMCTIGTYSCTGAFGTLGGSDFTLGAGDGSGSWGDFSMKGGTAVGDKVTLSVFGGAPTFEFRAGEGYATWDSFVRNFSVIRNNENPTPVPLPASVLFLVFGLGSIGLLGYRSRK